MRLPQQDQPPQDAVENGGDVLGAANWRAVLAMR
jgi:hypothetical protein